MKVYTIHVKSRSSRDEVEQVSEDEYIVRVKAAPEKGKANKDALKVFAQYLRVPQSSLMLTKGERYETKTILLLD